MRAKDSGSLLPDYQLLVIDEAHKFLAAARAMYGCGLSNAMLTQTAVYICRLKYKDDEAEELVKKHARKLHGEGKRLFKPLAGTDGGGGTARQADVSDGALRHLRNIYAISKKLAGLLCSGLTDSACEKSRKHLLYELSDICRRTAALYKRNGNIYWAEASGKTLSPGNQPETSLCSIPKDLSRRLEKDLWGKGISTVLTSGTMSAAGDFARIRRSLGLDGQSLRVTQATNPSPFDYREHALLYISRNTPFPDISDKAYVPAVTAEVRKLICASDGHAAVLFTSYKTMDKVWEQICGDESGYPMFKLGKGSIKEIESFKESGNGVLFAAGALWEGIDIPGDALSMLVIVKLPFQVPDAVSDYEKSQYHDSREYLDEVLVPDMLIKLKQGFGRLIRSETDTGAVAILDCRAGEKGTYHKRVIDALPDCKATSDIRDVVNFFRDKKPDRYFN